MIKVREVTPADRDAWLRLRCPFWDRAPAADHARDVDAFLGSLAAFATLHGAPGGR